MTPSAETTIEGQVPEKTKETKKRTVREFLHQYRSLGLPGAKQFRRRTRLANAAAQHDVDKAMIQGLIRRVSAYMTAMQELKKEENWATKNEGDEIVILWVGENDPLEIIKNAEKVR